MTYLVEAKWKQRRADINDVDALFTRLDETPDAVVGVLVSVSGFSRSVIDRVESRRARMVLLIDGKEIERAFDWDSDLDPLLRRKRDALLVHGEVDLGDRTVPRPLVRHSQDSLAATNSFFVVSDGSRSSWLSYGGDFGEFTCVRALPDIDWTTSPGWGVTVDLPLPVTDESELRSVLGELTAIGWAAESAHWTIQQATRNWHGLGALALMEALEGWSARFSEIDAVHHTEQLCYADACSGGFYTLTADIAASEPRTIWHADLSFQLIGVPVDPGPFVRLSERIGVDGPTYFRPRGDRSVVAHRMAPAERIDLATVALIVEENEDEDDPAFREWVVGLAVRNPYRAERAASPDWLPSAVSASELLVCDLRSSHPLSQPRTSYFLWASEWAWTSNAMLFRPIADW